MYGEFDFEQLEKDLKEFTSNSSVSFHKTDDILVLQSRKKKIEIGWFDDSSDLLHVLEDLEAKRGIPKDILAGMIIQDFLDVMVLPYKDEEDSLSDIIAKQLETDNFLEKDDTDIETDS